jgi:hypothetical protein
MSDEAEQRFTRTKGAEHVLSRAERNARLRNQFFLGDLCALAGDIFSFGCGLAALVLCGV